MPEVISEEPQELGFGQVWVSGSKTRPGLLHVTIRMENKGDWTCTCEGFQYRYKCKHITFLKDMLEDDDGFEDDDEVMVVLE